MNNAAERLLPLKRQQIRELAQDIISASSGSSYATLTIEEINKDREKVHEADQRDGGPGKSQDRARSDQRQRARHHDEWGTSRPRQRAAAEASTAKVEVAQQEQDGRHRRSDRGAREDRERRKEAATSVQGQKDTGAAPAHPRRGLGGGGRAGEAQSKRDREITIAQREAETPRPASRAEQSSA